MTTFHMSTITNSLFVLESYINFGSNFVKHLTKLCPSTTTRTKRNVTSIKRWWTSFKLDLVVSWSDLDLRANLDTTVVYLALEWVIDLTPNAFNALSLWLWPWPWPRYDKNILYALRPQLWPRYITWPWPRPWPVKVIICPDRHSLPTSTN